MKAKIIGYIDFNKERKLQNRKYHERPIDETVYKPFKNTKKILER